MSAGERAPLSSPRPLRPFGEQVPGTELVQFGVMAGRDEAIQAVNPDAHERKATRSRSNCYNTVHGDKTVNAIYTTGRPNALLEPLPRPPGLLGRVSMYESTLAATASPNLRASLRPMPTRSQPVLQGTHVTPQRPLLPPLENALNPAYGATTVRGPLPEKIDQELWSRRKIQFWEMGVIGPAPLSLDWRTNREYKQ